MPASPPCSTFLEPAPSSSLPYIIFSHADALIRMTSGGHIDLSCLGPLNHQHDADEISLQFNAGD